MAKNPKDGKLLYHITALENLPSIIKNGLLPRGAIEGDFIDVADGEILGKREKFDLESYTPFHFFSSSPFSGAVQIGNPDKEFVYLCITRALAMHNHFKIIPTHPLHYKQEPLDWEEGLKTIDWELMSKRDYSDYECKETCMAESIFQGSVPINLLNCIYVRTKEIRIEVVNLLKKENVDVRVNLNEGMFRKK